MRAILQYWLTGLFLVSSQRFRPGSQIVVNGYERTVPRIVRRGNVIKTYDGHRVVLPDADVGWYVVTVNTAHGRRRSALDADSGYGDSIDIAHGTILEAIAGVDGIEGDPIQQVLAWDLAPYSASLRARWQTSSARAGFEQRRVKPCDGWPQAGQCMRPKNGARNDRSSDFKSSGHEAG